MTLFQRFLILTYNNCLIDLMERQLGHSSVAILDPGESTTRTSGKAERTREFVLDGLSQVQKAFIDYDLIANLRLETYEGERYFHVPPMK